jgi:hypothetical protein
VLAELSFKQSLVAHRRCCVLPTGQLSIPPSTRSPLARAAAACKTQRKPGERPPAPRPDNGHTCLLAHWGATPWSKARGYPRVRPALKLKHRIGVHNGHHGCQADCPHTSPPTGRDPGVAPPERPAAPLALRRSLQRARLFSSQYYSKNTQKRDE